ncbi:MAG: DUF269 domain-containing protein [Prochloraceae cyanobacterium]
MSKLNTLEKIKQPGIFEGIFLQELVRQIRAEDTSGIYQKYDNEALLKSLMSPADKEQKNSEIAPLTRLRVSAFYRALAIGIEKRTGHSTETFINLTSKKFSSALVFCGGVLVVYQILKKVEFFGFESLEQLSFEAGRLIETAVGKAGLYLDFPGQISNNFQQN